MLKLNASYSKKVPADGEYTSQSYHASIEVELPDGLSAEQLNGKIHETFEMVRSSVEAELHGKIPLLLLIILGKYKRLGILPIRNENYSCYILYIKAKLSSAIISQFANLFISFIYFSQFL